MSDQHISELYKSYIKDIVKRDDIGSGINTQTYLEILEQNGFITDNVDAVQLSGGSTSSATSTVLQGIEADGNYILNDGRSSAVTVELDTGTDSFFIESLETAQGTTVDAAFGYSDLAGSYSLVSSYIDPNDPMVLGLLALLKEQGIITEDMSADNRAIAAYNYVVNHFDYIADYAGDDWNFCGETITAQGGDCEDLAILLSSLGMAALIDGGMSYADANARFTAVAGNSSLYGDHVCVEYTDSSGNVWIMDPAMAQQGEVGRLTQLQTAASWSTTFTTYFTFNDNSVDVAAVAGESSESLAIETETGKSYIDPGSDAVQAFVDELIEIGLFSADMSADQIVVNLYNYLAANFEIASAANSTWSFSEDTLGMRKGSAADLSILLLNTAVAVFQRFDVADASQSFTYSYGTLNGEAYAYVRYKDSEGYTRIIDIGGKMNPASNCLGEKPDTDGVFSGVDSFEFLKPLQHPYDISDFDRVLTLNPAFQEEGVFNIADQTWQKRIIKSFNPKFGLAAYLVSGGIVNERDDTANVGVGLQSYDPGKFDKAPTQAELDITFDKIYMINSYNSADPSTLDQSWAGNVLQSSIQEQIQLLFNLGQTSSTSSQQFYDTDAGGGFWAFKEDNFEALRDKLRATLSIYNVFISVGQSAAAARNLVEQEMMAAMDQDVSVYQQMGVKDMAQAEMQYVLRGTDQLKSLIIRNVSTHNKVWKQSLDKWVEAKRSWMSNNPKAVFAWLSTFLLTLYTTAGMIAPTLTGAFGARDTAYATAVGIPAAIAAATGAIILTSIQTTLAMGLAGAAATGLASAFISSDEKADAIKVMTKITLEAVAATAIYQLGVLIMAPISAATPVPISPFASFSTFTMFAGQASLFFALFGFAQQELEIECLKDEISYMADQQAAANKQAEYSAKAVNRTFLGKTSLDVSANASADPWDSAATVEQELKELEGTGFEPLDDGRIPLYISMYNCVAAAAAEPYDRKGRFDLLYTDEASLYTIRARLVRLQGATRLMARLFQEQGNERSSIHQEMTGTGSAQKSSTGAMLIDAELSTITGLFNRVVENRAAYASLYNARAERVNQKNKSEISLVAQMAAFAVYKFMAGLAAGANKVTGQNALSYAAQCVMPVARIGVDSTNYFYYEKRNDVPYISKNIISSARGTGILHSTVADLPETTDPDTRQDTMWDILSSCCGEGALQDGSSGISASDWVLTDYTKVVQARNALVNIANRIKVIAMLRHNASEGRNLIHQEMTGVSSTAFSVNDVVAAIDEELGYALKLLSTIATRANERVSAENTKTRATVKYYRSTAANLMELIPGCGAMISGISSLFFNLPGTGTELDIDYSSIWDGASYSKTANTVKNNFITGVEIRSNTMAVRDLFRQAPAGTNSDASTSLTDTNAAWYKPSYLFGSGVVRDLNENGYGTDNDLDFDIKLNSMDVQIPEINIKRVLRRIQDIINKGTLLSSWSSILASAQSARSVVHQEMTGIASRTQSGAAKGMVSKDTEVAFSNFTDQIQYANNLRQLMQWKAEATREMSKTIYSSILAGYFMYLYVFSGMDSMVAASYFSFWNGVLSLSFGIFEAVSLHLEIIERKKQEEENMANARTRKTTSDNNKAQDDTGDARVDALNEMDRQQKDMLEEMLNTDVASGGGINIAGAAVTMSKISEMNARRDQLVKVRQKQMQSRSAIKATMGGVGGAAGFGALQAVAALQGQGADMMAEQIMANLDARSQQIKALKQQLSGVGLKMIQTFVSMLGGLLGALDRQDKIDNNEVMNDKEEDKLNDKFRQAKSGEAVTFTPRELQYMQAQGFNISDLAGGNEFNMADGGKGLTLKAGEDAQNFVQAVMGETAYAALATLAGDDTTSAYAQQKKALTSDASLPEMLLGGFLGFVNLLATYFDPASHLKKVELKGDRPVKVYDENGTQVDLQIQAGSPEGATGEIKRKENEKITTFTITIGGKKYILSSEKNTKLKVWDDKTNSARDATEAEENGVKNALSGATISLTFGTSASGFAANGMDLMLSNSANAKSAFAKLGVDAKKNVEISYMFGAVIMKESAMEAAYKDHQEKVDKELALRNVPKEKIAATDSQTFLDGSLNQGDEQIMAQGASIGVVKMMALYQIDSVYSGEGLYWAKNLKANYTAGGGGSQYYGLNTGLFNMQGQKHMSEKQYAAWMANKQKDIIKSAKGYGIFDEKAEDEKLVYDKYATAVKAGNINKATDIKDSAFARTRDTIITAKKAETSTGKAGTNLTENMDKNKISTYQALMLLTKMLGLLLEVLLRAHEKQKAEAEKKKMGELQGAIFKNIQGLKGFKALQAMATYMDKKAAVESAAKNAKGDLVDAGSKALFGRSIKSNAGDFNENSLLKGVDVSVLGVAMAGIQKTRMGMNSVVAAVRANSDLNDAAEKYSEEQQKRISGDGTHADAAKEKIEDLTDDYLKKVKAIKDLNGVSDEEKKRRIENVTQNYVAAVEVVVNLPRGDMQDYKASLDRITVGEIRPITPADTLKNDNKKPTDVADDKILQSAKTKTSDKSAKVFTMTKADETKKQQETQPVRDQLTMDYDMYKAQAMATDKTLMDLFSTLSRLEKKGTMSIAEAERTLQKLDQLIASGKLPPDDIAKLNALKQDISSKISEAKEQNNAEKAKIQKKIDNNQKVTKEEEAIMRDGPEGAQNITIDAEKMSAVTEAKGAVLVAAGDDHHTFELTDAVQTYTDVMSYEKNIRRHEDMNARAQFLSRWDSLSDDAKKNFLMKHINDLSPEDQKIVRAFTSGGTGVVANSKNSELDRIGKAYRGAVQRDLDALGSSVDNAIANSPEIMENALIEQDFFKAFPELTKMFAGDAPAVHYTGDGKKTGFTARTRLEQLQRFYSLRGGVDLTAFGVTNGVGREEQLRDKMKKNDFSSDWERRQVTTAYIAMQNQKFLSSYINSKAASPSPDDIYKVMDNAKFIDSVNDPQCIIPKGMANADGCFGPDGNVDFSKVAKFMANTASNAHGRDKEMLTAANAMFMELYELQGDRDKELADLDKNADRMDMKDYEAKKKAINEKYANKMKARVEKFSEKWCADGSPEAKKLKESIMVFTAAINTPEDKPFSVNLGEGNKLMEEYCSDLGFHGVEELSGTEMQGKALQSMLGALPWERKLEPQFHVFNSYAAREMPAGKFADKKLFDSMAVKFFPKKEGSAQDAVLEKRKAFSELLPTEKPITPLYLQRAYIATEMFPPVFNAAGEDTNAGTRQAFFDSIKDEKEPLDRNVLDVAYATSVKFPVKMMNTPYGSWDINSQKRTEFFKLIKEASPLTDSVINAAEKAVNDKPLSGDKKYDITQQFKNNIAADKKKGADQKEYSAPNTYRLALNSWKADIGGEENEKVADMVSSYNEFQGASQSNSREACIIRNGHTYVMKKDSNGNALLWKDNVLLGKKEKFTEEDMKKYQFSEAEKKKYFTYNEKEKTYVLNADYQPGEMKLSVKKADQEKITELVNSGKLKGVTIIKKDAQGLEEMTLVITGDYTGDNADFNTLSGYGKEKEAGRKMDRFIQDNYAVNDDMNASGVDAEQSDTALLAQASGGEMTAEDVAGLKGRLDDAEDGADIEERRHEAFDDVLGECGPKWDLVTADQESVDLETKKVKEGMKSKSDPGGYTEQVDIFVRPRGYVPTKKRPD